MTSRMKKKTPPKSGSREFRVADQIQKDLSEMIAREIDIGQYGLITIQSIDLTPDFSVAKVYYTVLGAQPAHTQQILERKAGFFHSQLFRLLHIHTVPSLKFVHDVTTERAFEMDALIKRAVSQQSKD